MFLFLFSVGEEGVFDIGVLEIWEKVIRQTAFDQPFLFLVHNLIILSFAADTN